MGPEPYAATPPSECLRTVVASALNGLACRSDAKSQLKIVVCDVSRACIYAPAVRPVYVQLGDDDRGPEDDGKCGRFNISMHGTVDAALNLHQHC